MHMITVDDKWFKSSTLSQSIKFLYNFYIGMHNYHHFLSESEQLKVIFLYQKYFTTFLRRMPCQINPPTQFEDETYPPLHLPVPVHEWHMCYGYSCYRSKVNNLYLHCFITFVFQQIDIMWNWYVPRPWILISDGATLILYIYEIFGIQTITEIY